MRGRRAQKQTPTAGNLLKLERPVEGTRKTCGQGNTYRHTDGRILWAVAGAFLGSDQSVCGFESILLWTGRVGLDPAATTAILEIAGPAISTSPICACKKMPPMHCCCRAGLRAPQLFGNSISGHTRRRANKTGSRWAECGSSQHRTMTNRNNEPLLSPPK